MAGASFAPRAARWLGAMASFNVEAAAYSASPVDPQDRTQPTRLEIPFGHAFDRREISSSKSAVPTVVKGHFKPAYCRIVPDTAAACGGEPCVWTNGDGLWISRRDPRTCFRLGGVRPAAIPFGPLKETRVDTRSDCNAVPRRLQRIGSRPIRTARAAYRSAHRGRRLRESCRWG